MRGMTIDGSTLGLKSKRRFIPVATGVLTKGFEGNHVLSQLNLREAMYG